MTREKRLILDWTKVHDVIPIEKHLAEATSHIVAAKQSLVEKTGKGAGFTGWIEYIEGKVQEDIQNVERHMQDITQHSDALVVVGIGGSLLGTKAIYQALTHSFAAIQPASFHRKPLLFWAGHHTATDELAELLDVLDHHTPSLVIISKSGGTTEPALAFRVLKRYLEERFGQHEASHRIYTVTDPEEGTLRRLAIEKGWPRLSIPKNIGGRYSVFTPVGLLPLAVAGVDIREFVAGAAAASADCLSEKNHSLETNPALCYAAIRNILYENQYKVESLCTWTPKTAALGEWWKQLFGESDGKNHTGILPTTAAFTTDLHSLGQYFQDGERMLFATHVQIQDEYSLSNGSLKRKIRIPDAGIDDGFEFLTGRDLSSVQADARQGTFLAHADGGVPTLVWELPELNARWLGYWMYVNMIACAIGGYARGINPFDQPGVEDYKNNMFALMEKPGHTERAAKIRGRMGTGNRLRSLGLTLEP